MRETIARPAFIRRQRDFQVEKILKLRRRMTEDLVSRYQGRTLKTKVFQRFLDDLSGFLTKKIHPRDLENSVRYLVGSRLTPQMIGEACWRLAGNERRLARGVVITPWFAQDEAEWVPAQITTSVPVRAGRRGMELGWRLTFRVLAGSSCAMEIVQWWSRKKCFYMAHFKDENGNSFCFSRPPRHADRMPKHPFLDGRQFVSLRCLLLIQPELCLGRPNFKTIAFSPSLSDWNREQQRYREHREEAYACPHNYSPELLCHKCPVGQDQCRASVHAKTYVSKVCPSCEEASFFDPTDRLAKVCVQCAERAVFLLEGNPG